MQGDVDGCGGIGADELRFPAFVRDEQRRCADARVVVGGRLHTDARARRGPPGWRAVSKAYSKRLTHALAERIGVAYPWTRYPRDLTEVATLDCCFPVILKPDVKPQENRFTRAKAWRVDDRASLVDTWRTAAALVGSEAVMVQELIPGGGESQYSFAALCREGEPVAWLTSRRVRQYPRDSATPARWSRRCTTALGAAGH